MKTIFQAARRSAAFCAFVLATVSPMASAQTLPLISINDVSVQEGNSGTKALVFTVSLSKSSSSTTTFDVSTQNATATAGSDYVALSLTNQTIPAGQTSKTVSVTINGDTAPEQDETFALNLTKVTSNVDFGHFSGTGIIANDDLPTITMADVSVDEGSNGHGVGVWVAFSAQTTMPVSFDVVTTQGTATEGQDYAKLQDHVVVTSGNTGITVFPMIFGDADVEPNETFNLSISNVVGAVVGDGQATVTLLNDDGAPPPALSIGDVAITEGNSGTKNAAFTVSLSKPATADVVYDVSVVNGTATSGSDYSGFSFSNLVISAGQSSATINVTINGDTEVEPDETFTVNIGNVRGATVADDSATGTIKNDDGGSGGATLSINDVTVSEGNASTRTATFTISLSAAQSGPVTVNVATADGTATAGSDYVAKSQTGLRIPAGSTSKTFSVTINGDTSPEPDETFAVNLSNPSGATLADGVATGTISNDDAAGPPSLSIADVSSVEGNSGTKSMDFVVTLSAPSATDVVYDFATWSGSAAGNSDFEMRSERLTIPAGTTSQTVSITMYGDVEPELDETFEARLTQVSSNVVFADGQAVGTIIDDDYADAPTISIADASVLEGNSGSTDLAFTISLSKVPASPVCFELRPASGSATAYEDFQGSYTSTCISGSDTSKTIAVPIIGDTTPELDETFTASLVDITGGIAGVVTATGTILNDDGATGPTLSIGDVTITEGNSGGKSATFTVSLSAPSSSGVSYYLQTANGTAAADGDYVQTYANQSIPAGQTSNTFSVQINGDTTVEPDETFFVNVSNVSGAILGDSQGTGTITNDDTSASTPTLSVIDLTLSEGNAGQQTAIVTVALSQPTDKVVSYTFTTSDGTATAGSDYEARNVQVLIPPGEQYTTFPAHIYGDTAVEGDETFNVTLSAVSNATLADGQGVVTIRNDDGNGTPTLTVPDISVSEGNANGKEAIFTVSLSAPAPAPVTIYYHTAAGSATTGQDYIDLPTSSDVIPTGQSSLDIPVTVLGDTTVESDETFTLYVYDVDGAALVDGQAQATIVNDDGGATPSLSIGDLSIAEGNSGTKTATFTVSLSAAASSTVSFDVATANGTATAGSDYVALALTGQTIAAGQTSKTVSVTINGDTTVESDETFNVNVSNVSGATVADGAALGTITNDDAASGPTLSIGDFSVAEGNSLTKTATFTITLSAAQSGPVLVDVATANGTATAGSDYVAKSQTGLRIPAGSTSKTFAVTINGDTTSEPDETFTVNLSNASGATIADGVGLGTITNDDAVATPTLSVADASVSEGNSGTKTLTFTVSLSPAASGTVSYDIATSSGTATAGSDYVASTLTGQTISAGATSKTFAVTINGDTATEANETFNVTLSNVSGAIVGDGAAVGTISNDDGGSGPTLSIGDVSIAEGNALTKQMTFTVSLSAAASTAVTYNIATANGTAVAPTDYTAKSLTGQSIPAGTTSKTFVVVIKGDKTVEPNETFLVNVTNATGATIADGQATGTITNDDAAALSIARFDARGIVDDVDDGNHQPQIAPGDYATLLADSANQMCRRAPNATVIAVDRVEHKQVLADLADAANTLCASKPQYTAVMADADSRGFLIATPAKGELGTTVLGAPEANVAAKSTTLSILGAGHATPVTIVLASETSKTLAQQLQQRARALPNEAIVLLGANQAVGYVDLTAREFGKAKAALPAERVLASPTLLRAYAKPSIGLPVLPAHDKPAQVLELQ